MPEPRRMANTTELAAGKTNGAIWKLEPGQRDLDANVISLAPSGEIGEHQGPELDVVLHVFAGSGVLHTASGSIELAIGDIIYLPARSQRRFVAGEAGLGYFSVHQRKKRAGLMPALRGS
ncbi:quercetin dioxygenase-like cupin family protein [Arthrobacter sp. JUb119]|uniref:cupin domain-containing protein n=1 Tax=Micrococcaceae TaxID=1268 RepID=UPI000CFD32C8|nr:MULTISPECIES: cupin domain-containing protein [unclassified Arthrobacter]MCS3491712.1 quercetin dioxygenase-like cupin family protein [Arthrobacter sp. JUb119]PQZ85671.1 cupin [Arthrobacter sp. MYb222]PRB78338.1 cupin [Arthrobacter sp. MYb214]TDU29342.1 mannose-6-phosphate isomerase-like protein (cupin superfamily) [Arthrobacter sp. JUb115]